MYFTVTVQSLKWLGSWWFVVDESSYNCTQFGSSIHKSKTLPWHHSQTTWKIFRLITSWSTLLSLLPHLLCVNFHLSPFPQPGIFTFCFSNEMSTFTTKIVNFSLQPHKGTVKLSTKPQRQACIFYDCFFLTLANSMIAGVSFCKVYLFVSLSLSLSLSGNIMRPSLDHHLCLSLSRSLCLCLSLSPPEEYHIMEKEATAAGLKLRNELEARFMKIGGKLKSIQTSQKRQNQKVKRWLITRDGAFRKSGSIYWVCDFVVRNKPRPSAPDSS